MAGLPTGTVTLLFTDIEGSTSLVHRLGDGFGAVREQHRRLLRRAVAEAGGHEVECRADEFFAVFQRAKDGAAAAVSAQRLLAGHAWPEGITLRVRMGLHTGEPGSRRRRVSGCRCPPGGRGFAWPDMAARSCSRRPRVNWSQAGSR